MTLWMIAPGLLLIGVAAHDLFDTLFHPAGRGALSDRIGRAVWFIVRRLAAYRRSVITLAGPLAILSIMVMWLLCFVFGFALIYAPFMHNQFAFAAGIDPGSHQGFLDQ